MSVPDCSIAALQMESSQGIYASGQMFPTAAGGITTPQVYSVYRAAALLLDALAANKSRLASVNKLLDVELSAGEAAKELRATAKEYREVEQNGGAFAISEWVGDSFSARERIWHQLLRINGS